MVDDYKDMIITTGYMAMDDFAMLEINDRAAESAEQHQPARTCRLMLLYSLRKTNP